MKPVKHVEAEPEVVSRIIELLLQQGKAQQDLTLFLGIHRNSITEWKAGRSKSYRTHIDRIAEFLGVSPTYLLRGESTNDEYEKLKQLFGRMNMEQRIRLLDTAFGLLNGQNKKE